jgi:hypothetical protein
VFDGEIFVLDASAQSSRLASITAEHAALAFGCARGDLPRVHERLAAEEAWRRTCAARASLASDPSAMSAAIALAKSLGFALASLAVDAPRLRIVEPLMHLRPSAQRAFYAHRDTWYGCPRAQVNAWIPLFDVDERDSFAIYPSAFGTRVDNDSAAFDYLSFARVGGFQSAQLTAAVYPRAIGSLPGEPRRARARANQVVVFSPAHLHATTPNETGHTRASVDVRFVDVIEHRQGIGAADVDNRSRGSALVDYKVAGAS